MGRKAKNAGKRSNKIDNNKSEKTTSTPKRRKIENDSNKSQNKANVTSSGKSALDTGKQTPSRVRRRLTEALELDRSINSNQGKGNEIVITEAEKLMYAILPAKSRIIAQNNQRDSNKDVANTETNNDKNANLNANKCKDSTQLNLPNMSVAEVLKQQLAPNTNGRDPVEVREELPKTIQPPSYHILNSQNSKNTNFSRVLDTDQEEQVLSSPVFQMRVNPGEDDLEISGDEISEQGEDSNEESGNESDMAEFESQDESVVFQDAPETDQVRTPNIPLINFEEFKDRPEVKQFMMKMYKATVEKNGKPSVVQEQVRAVNNIKLQINTKQNRGKHTTPNKETKLVKSPSDSTVYTPALRKRKLQKTVDSSEYVDGINKQATQIIEGMADKFINNVRLRDFPSDGASIPRRMAPPQSAQPCNDSRIVEDTQTDILEQQTRARKIAERAIIEAEKFKAKVIPPAGNSPMIRQQNVYENLNNQTSQNDSLSVPPVDLNFNDDNPNNFCQVTNHVESNTEVKIAKGAFVEMTKIAPPKTHKLDNNDKKLELVSKEGKTFWLPIADKEPTKINNFRQWEQSFKVYAAIYTRYNPHRGAEIYQYVHSISLAASSYVWDNVAYYDYHFRKLMGDNPQRSWAKVNTQLWSLSMREPITNKPNYNNINLTGYSKKNTSAEWKDICCWRHNKNRCSKKASECKYQHRCSHCGSQNHIYPNCPRKRGSSFGGGQDQQNNDQHKKNHKNERHQSPSGSSN